MMNTAYQTENTCPECGSHNIEYGLFQQECNYAYYECYCNDCQLSYNEVYTLTFKGNEI